MTAPVQPYGANDVDPFAGGDKRPSVSFKNMPVGTVYTLVVDGTPSLVQSRDYETGEPATWPDGNPKMTVALNVKLDGEERSLWAPKPSSMFTALAEAQRAAGAKLEPGGTLVVKFDSEEPNKKNPRLNAQKIYKAKYTPPAPKDAFADDAPF